MSTKLKNTQKYMGISIILTVMALLPAMLGDFGVISVFTPSINTNLILVAMLFFIIFMFLHARQKFIQGDIRIQKRERIAELKRQLIDVFEAFICNANGSNAPLDTELIVNVTKQYTLGIQSEDEDVLKQYIQEIDDLLPKFA